MIHQRLTDRYGRALGLGAREFVRRRARPHLTPFGERLATAIFRLERTERLCLGFAVDEVVYLAGDLVHFGRPPRGRS